MQTYGDLQQSKSGLTQLKGRQQEIAYTCRSEGPKHTPSTGKYTLPGSGELTRWMTDSWQVLAPVTQRDLALPPHKMPVALILWVHGHSRVAHDGLRPGGAHGEELVRVCHRVLEVKEEASLLCILHLQQPDHCMQASTGTEHATG